MAKPGYLPCNGKCGKMVPPRSHLGGSMMCGPCRAERQGFDQIFWAHNPLHKMPWDYWRLVREIEAEDRQRSLALAPPPPPPPTAPDPDPDDPSDERNMKGGAAPGIFQFNESTCSTGWQSSTGNHKSVYDRDAKRISIQPFKTKIISVARWTKAMRKPSKARYEAAMAKQHEAQALAIRRELFAPILADVLARGGSANQMEAYRLRAVEDLTQAETARKMRCSEKNIEKLIKKSRTWVGVQNLSRFRPV